VSFECAHGFSVGFAFGGAAFEVGAGSFVVEGAAESDGVERVVGLAVPAAGEAVADRLAGGRGFWCGAVIRSLPDSEPLVEARSLVSSPSTTSKSSWEPFAAGPSSTDRHHRAPIGIHRGRSDDTSATSPSV